MSAFSHAANTTEMVGQVEVREVGKEGARKEGRDGGSIRAREVEARRVLLIQRRHQRRLRTRLQILLND